MIPDHSRLLDDLVAARPDSGEALLEALRLRRRRKTPRRAIAIAGLAIAAIAAGRRLLPPERPPASVAAAPARVAMLTRSELLDSFGDQPVALVRWPDGREQLLAICPPPPRRATR